MTLQERMVDYRAAHNLTQSQFADRVGVTTMTINQVENNRQNPSKLTIAKIERVVGKE